MSVRRNFSRGGNVNILLILVRLLTMQCKYTFTKLFTVSTRIHHKVDVLLIAFRLLTTQRKWMLTKHFTLATAQREFPCYDSGHKNALRWQQ